MMYNNFLESLEVNNIKQLMNPTKGNRPQKRNSKAYNSGKYENDLAKSANVNPMKLVEN